jgi:hypothetical protein
VDGQVFPVSGPEWALASPGDGVVVIWREDDARAFVDVSQITDLEFDE